MSTSNDIKRALASLRARLGPTFWALTPHEREELVQQLLRPCRPQHTNPR